MVPLSEECMSGMITVEEALARVIASAEAPLDEERVALDEACGRVLTRDLSALRTQPPFPNSAMDGYALRAADSSPAAAVLTVIGESAAGRAFERAIGRSEAVRIFTGAPMPAGADAIVMQENVRKEGHQRVRLSSSVSAGENLRPAGMDFHEGEALVAAGRRLTPRDVALAAAANHVDLPVRRRARVAVLATARGAGRRARSRADRRVQQFRSGWNRCILWRRDGRPRHRSRPHGSA